MSSCKNIIMLIGHVGNDPEKLEDSITSTKFHLFTNKSFYSAKKEKFVQMSERHLIKAWKQNAEYTLNNIVKGDYVWVEGELHYHIVNVDNRRIVNPEIIASSIIKLNKKTYFLEEQIKKIKDELIELNNTFNNENYEFPEEYQQKYDEIISKM
jgi:single-stranded DNA-binding protein